MTASAETARQDVPSSGGESGYGPKGDNVLEVLDLRVYFYTDEGLVRAVDGISFTMRRRRIMALVGESGCGKSVTGYSLLRLIQVPGEIESGSIWFYSRKGKPIDIVKLAPNSRRLLHLRGGSISMIFQEPMAALSPVHTIGAQICEAIRLHQDVSKEGARERTVAMLAKLGIPSPEQRFNQYPFEVSGGMRQRVGIAMALVCNPEILIADEPTTALDVTIQAQVMGIMKHLQRELGTSILLITHDLGVVAQMADDVAVIYLGRVVEAGTVRDVLKRPRHPYTIGLLKAQPDLADPTERLSFIKGNVPSPLEIPPGCPFHPRCPHYQPGRCDVGEPPLLEETGPGHQAACLRLAELPKEEFTR